MSRYRSRNRFRNQISAGAGAYPLSFATLGIVADGFVIDGTVSQFWTDSAMTTPAVSTDPIGAAEDLSGNGNNLLQTNSGNKPQLGVSGSVKFFGLESDLYLDPDTAVNVGAAMTVIAVVKAGASTEAYFLCTYDGGWGTGGYFAALAQLGAGDNLGFTGNGTATWSTVAGNGASAAIYENVRTGTGANQNVLTSYTAAGAQIATATSTEGASPANALRVGINTVSGSVNVAFVMVVKDALSAGQLSTVRAALATKFGGW